MTPAQLDLLLRETFPMKATNERASLEYVELTEHAGAPAVVLRLICWDRSEPDGALSIRDIKEQAIHFPIPAGPRGSSERVREYLRALANVLTRVLAHDEIITRMPYELLRADPLKLATAHTEADFVKALSVKSRLGRWLPAS